MLARRVGDPPRGPLKGSAPWTLGSRRVKSPLVHDYCGLPTLEGRDMWDKTYTQLVACRAAANPLKRRDLRLRTSWCSVNEECRNVMKHKSRPVRKPIGEQR